jgi:hypothetical protein
MGSLRVVGIAAFITMFAAIVSPARATPVVTGAWVNDGAAFNLDYGTYGKSCRQVHSLYRREYAKADDNNALGALSCDLNFISSENGIEGAK